jgi:hypothetical protein
MSITTILTLTCYCSMWFDTKFSEELCSHYVHEYDNEKIRNTATYMIIIGRIRSGEKRGWDTDDIVTDWVQIRQTFLHNHTV